MCIDLELIFSGVDRISCLSMYQLQWNYRKYFWKVLCVSRTYCEIFFADQEIHQQVFVIFLSPYFIIFRYGYERARSVWYRTPFIDALQKIVAGSGV